MYSSCTAHVQLMYSSCTAHVQLMYSSCTAHVQLTRMSHFAWRRFSEISCSGKRDDAPMGEGHGILRGAPHFSVVYSLHTYGTRLDSVSAFVACDSCAAPSASRPARSLARASMASWTTVRQRPFNSVDRTDVERHAALAKLE